jgi:hypothetical protein
MGERRREISCDGTSFSEWNEVVSVGWTDPCVPVDSSAFVDNPPEAAVTPNPDICLGARVMAR